MPWYVEWILSFPRAPLGTVSIQAWGAACAVAISVAGDAAGSIVVNMRTGNGQKGSKQGAMKMESGAPAESKKTS